MIEKRYEVCNGERVGTYAIYDMLKDCVSSEVRFKFEIEELCAKLNHLAALEQKLTALSKFVWELEHRWDDKDLANGLALGVFEKRIATEEDTHLYEDAEVGENLIDFVDWVKKAAKGEYNEN